MGEKRFFVALADGRKGQLRVTQSAGESEYFGIEIDDGERSAGEKVFVRVIKSVGYRVKTRRLEGGGIVALMMGSAPRSGRLRLQSSPSYRITGRAEIPITDVYSQWWDSNEPLGRADLPGTLEIALGGFYCGVEGRT